MICKFVITTNALDGENPPILAWEEQFLGNIEWRLKLIVGLNTHKQTLFNMVQLYLGR